jgi:hypothetical protein
MPEALFGKIYPEPINETEYIIDNEKLELTW